MKNKNKSERPGAEAEYINASAYLSYSSLIGVSDADRDQIKISEKSRYSDTVWDLSHLDTSLRPSDMCLRFYKIKFDDGSDLLSAQNKPYLRLLKEFAFSILIDPPVSHPKWSSICNGLHKGLSRLVKFMQDNAILSLSNLTEYDFQKFLDELAGLALESGGEITNHTLVARVYGIHWLYEQSSKLEEGLSFDPFLDYGSMSQWASTCCQKVIPRNIGSTIEMPDKVAADLLSHALKDLSIADTLVAIELERSVYKPKKVGSKYNSVIVNPFPWRKYGIESGIELASLYWTLSAACYIVIAMLSGMRMHEIAAIKSGEDNYWLKKDIEHEGMVKTFCFVISKTNKLQARPTEYMWQTLPIVKVALDAMEKGLALRRKSGFFLFPATIFEGQRVSRGSIGAFIKRYALLHNISYEGKIWSPATHQFRKKYARIMVRSGLGLRELQDQLKHFDIEMTRGYGDINLYVELQQEKLQLSTEQYDELLSGTFPIIGGGAGEIKELRKRFLGMTKRDRLKLLADLPVSALIEQVDDGLCMYRASKALCGGNKSACRPADCNNSILSAVGKRKTYEWRRQENIRLLSYSKSQPLKAAFLKGRISELDKLLQQVDVAEGDV